MEMRSHAGFRSAVDISVLFKELYSFITYGINMSGEASAEYEDVDPADNLFRIRMVCQLLGSFSFSSLF